MGNILYYSIIISSILLFTITSFSQVEISSVDDDTNNNMMNLDKDNGLKLIEPINPLSLNESLSGLDLLYKLIDHKIFSEERINLSLISPISPYNNINLDEKNWDVFLDIIKNKKSGNDNNNGNNKINENNKTDPDKFVDPQNFGGNILFLIIDKVKPDKNSEGYAIISADKKRIGHTNKALLSEYKYRKIVLPVGKHLIQIEKYNWDNSKNEWVRYPNFEQPKPFQITIKNLENVIVIEMIYNSDTKSYHTRSFFLTYKHLEDYAIPIE